MSAWLLDVNALLGCAWKTHADHSALLAWLLDAEEWSTCPLTESGFIRISMTSAFQATFENAQKSLKSLRALQGHKFLHDDVNAALFPAVSSYRDTTDAHLVTLAKRHGLKLATLDTALTNKSWAVGVAVNPLLLPA